MGNPNKYHSMMEVEAEDGATAEGLHLHQWGRDPVYREVYRCAVVGCRWGINLLPNEEVNIGDYLAGGKVVETYFGDEPIADFYGGY